MLNYTQYTKNKARIENIASKHAYDDSTDSVDREGILKMKEHIISQLEIGKKVEMEHNMGEDEAIKIALDHLDETPDYYTKLGQSGLIDEI
jgi:hypothetical protein